jgi:muramoyltetrapeptide carboxypeptidase
MPALPQFLQKGDTVLMIATARARSQEAVQPAVDILNSWGLKIIPGKNAFKVHHQFAGTDEERIHDLQWALDYPGAKAILISGGGYGTMRVVDHVNFDRFSTDPKWIIGYSDTTVLHARLQRLGFAAIHGTMAFQFNRHAGATDSLRKLLFNEKIDYHIPAHVNNRPGQCSGQIVGGNLSLLVALGGSDDDLKTDGKILFIEDLDEQLYHIDRMMLQLKRSRKLEKLAGLIVGGLTEMKDNVVPFGSSAEEIVWDTVKEYRYPVCFNFPAGHIQENVAVYFGVESVLTVSEAGSKLIYK